MSRRYENLWQSNRLSHPMGYYEPSSEALGLMGGSTHCLRADGATGSSTLHGLCVPGMMPYSNSNRQSYNVAPTYASECGKWCLREGTPGAECVNMCEQVYFHPHNRV